MAGLELNDARLIVDTCDKHGLTIKQAAYVVATAFWETNRTFKPVEEAYWLSDDWRRRNLRYYPWHGRGFVQLTWERNYKFAGQCLGLDLTTDPKVVMQPEISVEILVCGSMEGWFTGSKLGDFVNNAQCDYEGARRVINGTDKARSIAELAREFELDLAVAGYQGATAPESSRPALRFGMEGVAVAELQSDLADLGYFSGSLDGYFGPLTRASVLAFQADQGLATDARVGPATWAALSDAEPRPLRDVDPAEIEATSGIASDARMTERTGDIIGVGGAAVLVQQVSAASDVLEGASGGLERLTAVVSSNLPLFGLVALCLVAWLVLRGLGYTQKRRRVRDAREHRSLSR